MREIGAYEAKTHLPKLLDEVAEGERIVITKHGVPVAHLVPVPGVATNASARTAVAELKVFRRKHKRGRTSLRSMIEQGRK